MATQPGGFFIAHGFTVLQYADNFTVVAMAGVANTDFGTGDNNDYESGESTDSSLPDLIYVGPTAASFPGPAPHPASAAPTSPGNALVTAPPPDAPTATAFPTASARAPACSPPPPGSSSVAPAHTPRTRAATPHTSPRASATAQATRSTRAAERAAAPAPDLPPATRPTVGPAAAAAVAVAALAAHASTEATPTRRGQRSASPAPTETRAQTATPTRHAPRTPAAPPAPTGSPASPASTRAPPTPDEAHMARTAAEPHTTTPVARLPPSSPAAHASSAPPLAPPTAQPLLASLGPRAARTSPAPHGTGITTASAPPPSPRSHTAHSGSTLVHGHLPTAPLLRVIAAAQETAAEQETGGWVAAHGYARLSSNDFTVVTRHGRAWVPSDAHELKALLLEEAHSSSGFRGSAGIIEALRGARVAWTGYRDDAAAHAASSPVHQHSSTARPNSPGTRPATDHGELQPTLAPAADHTVSADFYGPLPCTPSPGRFTYVLVLVDLFTRWVELSACVAATSACAIQGLASWCYNHGVPVTARTDGGPHFSSNETQRWTDARGIRLQLGCPDHAQGQGLVERRNGLLTPLLKALCAGDRTSWARHLPSAAFIINTSYCRGIGMSPWQARYGRAARSDLAARVGLLDLESAPLEAHLDQLASTQSLALLASAVGQAENKTRFDGAHTAITFKPGDYVLLVVNTDEKLATAGVVHIVASRHGHSEYLVHRPYEPSKLRRVPVSRLRAYNARRTNLEADATASLGPEWRIISSIVGHTDNPGEPRTFTVEFADGTRQPLWTAKALEKIACFHAYLKTHGLPRK